MRYTLFKRVFLFWMVLTAALGVAKAQIYQIGDVYVFPDSSKGIICYVNPDNPVEGWAVALNDVGWVSKTNNQQYYMINAGCTLPSGMENHLYDNNAGIGRYGLSEWTYEGKNNTHLLLESGQSPAAEAVDFYNGWYIPDAIQMRHIFGLLPFIESAIVEAGGDPNGVKWMYEYNNNHGHDYWTSTRVNGNQMLVVRGSQYFYNPRTPADHSVALNSNNSTKNCIRAVRDFGTDAYAYWVDKPKSASMTVNPTVNTSFDAYVIFNSDTIRVTSSAIVHEKYDKDTLYEVVCSSPNPYTSVVNPNFTDLDISHVQDYTPYRVTLQTVHGCDSIITLMLKVNPSYEFTESAFICQNAAPYLWRGRALNASGVYYDTLKTVCCDCDSVYVLNLTVAPLPEMTITPEHPVMCAGGSVELSASAINCSDYSEPLTENFDGVTGTDQDITSSLSTLTDFFNSGQKVFSAGNGVVRLGTGSVFGQIVSKPLDLSENFTLDLSMKGWIRTGSSEPAATRVRVAVDNVYADTVTVQGSNQNNPGSFETYSLNFNAATASSVIKIEAIDEVAPGSPYAEERFYIDFMRISDNSPCGFEWYDGNSLLSSASSVTVHPVATKEYYVEVTSAAGCKKRDTVEVDVHDHFYVDTFATACNSFTWHGQTYTTSGNYERWLTCQAGCDSVVTLHLTLGNIVTGDTTAFACESFDWYEHHNITSSTESLTHMFTNASGCDSVVTLHLTVGHSNTGDTTAFACDSFDWYEHTNITSSTDALTHTFTNASGCDSVVTLHLTVGHSNTGDTTAFACDRFDWYEHTNITSSTDALTHTFTNASGCDSVVTLHLTIVHSNTGDTTAFACGSFDWYEHHNITSSTDALTHTFTNASGCDSVVTLHLTVGHSNTGDTTAFACDSFDWYEHTNITSSTDALTHTFTNASGCDSVVTLHLTVGHSNTGDTTAFACDSFDWYEHTNITSSTDALTHTFTNASGCDSVVTLHLTVGHSNTGDTTAFACNRFDWYEHTNITSSTDALTHTFTNASGCDSVVTLHLTVGHSNTGDTTAFACNSFDWYEHTNITSSTNSLTHTFTNASGCDSVVTLHLTVGYSNTGDTTVFACDSFDWYEHTNITSSTDALTHTFTNASGCDSVVTLHLTVGHSNTGDTTAFACNSFDWYEHTNITSSTDALTHTFTNASGCDSVVTLHLTVGHSNTGDTTAFACNRFDWYEHTNITSSTDALTHTFTNASGCDSVVTLHLTVGHSNTGDTTAFACNSFDWYEHHNITSSTDALTHTFTNASGCDSVVTLHLTVGHSNTGDTTAFSCVNFTWYGTTYTSTPFVAPTHTFTNASGCDSVVTLHLTIGDVFYGDTTAFACNSFDWYEHHNITSSTNSLTHMFTSVNGCDSLVTLHLTVGHSNTGDTTAFACDRFDWYEHTNITSSTDALTHTFTNANGCDSVVTLHLTVGHSNTGDTTAFACNSFDWYEHSNITSSTDALTHTFTNASGCDSVVTLHLTVGHSNTGDTTAFACDRFDWYEHHNITSSTNSLTHTFTNASGCDSVVTLHLTVGHSNTGDTTAFACDRFDWYEHTKITSSTNSLTHTFTNASGCDSVVTLHLTVGHSNTGDTTAFACDRFDWYGHTNITSSTNSLTHTFTNASGCDSVVTLHLTVGHSNTGDTTAFACDRFDWYEHTNITSSTDALTHTFTNASGCDSVVTLHLTVGHSNTGDTTAFACDRFDWYEHHNITSSTNSLTHTFTNASGCDSVVRLHLTVGHSNTGDTTAFACDRFDWYEHHNITSSTNALTHTFTNASGCDSVVTLHLTVGHSNTGDTTAFACDRFDWYEHHNITSSTDALTHTFTNASGCDSVVTLHLTVGHSNTGDTTAFACDRFDWYEHTNITSSTDALTHTFTNASGCDSVVTLHLTVGHSNTGDTTAFACNSFDWYEHHNITSSTNALTHTFTNASGCDSVVTLHLTVGHSNTGDTTAFACDRFDWYEHTNITSSTDALTHTFTNASGCDSVVTLHLTVGHSNTGDTTAFACDRFDWYGHTNITSSTNSLTHTFTNASGCDSVVTLHLTVGHSNTGDTTAFACDRFDWYEHTNITSSTDALTHTFTNASGCDSVVTLHLTVGHSNTGDTTAFACDRFDWYEHTNITSSTNSLTHTFTNASGCDSVVTLHLTVGHSNTGDTTAFACDRFDWYEHTNITSSTNSLTHTFTNASGCDSVVTLHLTIGLYNTSDTTAFACNSFDWYEHHNITSSTNSLTHTFTNASGCDSVVTLHLTVGHSNTGDTTAFACDRFDWYEHTNITSSTDALTHTFTNASGCDSVVTLHLTVGHSNTGDTTAFACDRFDWYEHTNITSSTDALTHTFTNASGCDSVVTLHLTVGHSNTGDTTAFACNSFDWYEHHNITSSTEALTHTFTNASGCDSVVTLHLTVGHSNTGDTTAFACNRFDWYEHHNITSSTDALTHTFTNASGCDSVVTLHLTVGHSNTGDTTAFACNSFDWYEHHNITSSTDALTHTFTNASGCDSVVTLHLTVGHSNTGDTTAFACNRFDWYEHHNITSSTDALTHTFTNASGCDSVVTLHLTVGHSNTGDTTAFACDRFDWYEHTNITSSTDALTHTFTNASGCDSVVTLHLTVGHSNTGDTTAFACDRFDWYEHTNITSSTDALTHTFTNASGCDSVVTLHLTVGHSNTGDTTAFACNRFDWYEHTNITSSTDALTHTFTNASGCDSVVTLHLTVGHSNTGDTTAFACDRFDWYEHTNITSSTDALTHTFTNASGCDSVVTLHLTVGHSNTGDTTAFACDRFDWYEHTNITSSTNSLTHTFTNASGCDSVVTLHLTVGHSNTGDTTAFACNRFDWYEHTNITSSTDALTHTFTNASGCDSVVTLHLTVGHSNTGDTTAFACDRFDWYEHTNITSSTNSLTHTFTNASGCDSVVTLHLTVGHSNTGDTTAVACESFDWYEHTNITSSTDALTHTFMNASGCDSVVTLHLIVHHPVHQAITRTACESFDWNGTTYYSSGIYTYSHPCEHGCTQVDTLHLTINHITYGDTTAVECGSFTWHGITYKSTPATDPTYTMEGGNHDGCDSVVTLHLTIRPAYVTILEEMVHSGMHFPFEWNGINITGPGNYSYRTTASNGCDSTVKINFVIQGCDINVTPIVTNEICGNDGTITVTATGGYSDFYYSVDAGVNFYTSPVFTGLSAGFYVVVAHDDFGCYSVGYGVVHPSHGLAISCPPDVNDVLDFGECEMEIPTADISEPTVNATNINLDVSHYPPTTVSGTWTYPTLADWPAYTVTSDKPTDNMYAEGDNVITWTVNDPVCGPKTCQQHVYVTFPECPDAIDCEGNVYHGIRIDCDCWTQTNLKSTRYSDCSLIPTVYEYYSSMTPDVAENVERFGRLYSFESAVRDSADNGHGHIQGICPAGWYLPTPEKYETLSLHGADALKSPMYWLDGGGSNTTGFSALPAGWYNGSRDRYEGMYGETYFWSTKGVGATTESSAYGLIFNCDVLFKAEDRSGVGYSIRCIKEKK